MNMKHFYRLLSCILLAAGAVIEGHATIHYGDPIQYKICPGDTITVDTRQAVVLTDTIIYDTIVTSINPPELDTLINTYNVSMYPTFIKIEPLRTIERGTTFDWHGLTISRAGSYERVFKSTHECDSIFRITVRERVEKHITDTLCLGSSISFGGQTLTEAGIYRDSLHYADYDSIVILSLIGHKPDTTTKNIRIPEGTSVTWNGESYSTGGVYDKVYTDRFGCDSLSRLVLTVYHVDTIDTVAVICPSESITWHGMTYSQTGKYEFPGTRDNGDRVFYRIDLTVKTLVEVPVHFSVCDDEDVTFNGQTYRDAGTFYDRFTCDTIYKIVITKNPTSLHYQTGVLIGSNPFYWTYQYNGEQKTDTLTAPGRYEHTTVNEETGCNDTWVLELTKDATSYHFVEEKTICANEPFSWRGRENLNQQGIGQTTHYFDNYRTISDQDSIYELVLTVNPVLTSTQTIKYCGSITVGGATYSESTVLVDTFTSVQYGCDSIVTTILVKGEVFHLHDTLTLVPGETATWRGQTINHDGIYEERHTSSFGCDSIYSLGVGYKAATPVTNTHTDKVTICEGNYHVWRGDKYFNSGIFNDTVYVNGDAAQGVDSIYILNLTVHPTYYIRERITFHSFPAEYRGYTFSEGETHEFHYTTADGHCDSIIAVVAELEVTRTEETVTICDGDTYIWKWNGSTYTESGRYVVTVKDGLGYDSVEHILNLTVRFIPETFVTKTICKGGSYTFGDRTLTEAGVYDYTFQSGTCDSLVHLSLNVVNADTNILVHHMNAGETFSWGGKIYRETGTYFQYGTNRFGCDSVSVLELTINHVDTVDTTLTICPDEIPFVWHGISASQTGDYQRAEQQADGSYNYYRLHLTVREITRTDTTFTICDDEQVIFNGKTYTQSGRFFDYLSCDTVMEIIINKHPQQVYETRAALGQDKYTWTYGPAGQTQTVEYDTPGTYEFEFPNETTGCSELWRLILSQDMNEYHFEETLTICEGDNFSWHGMDNLSHQHIGETYDYIAEYKTRNGKDSIYTLHLTVTPIQRTYRTIRFCGETEYKGIHYTNSAQVYDTLTAANGCDSIILINLDKAQSYFFQETKQLPQGKVFNWHGIDIYTDGVYRDEHTTEFGCDSIYELRVTIIPATPQTNQYAEEWSICSGDTVLWRGMDLWRPGQYVDTVWSAGKQKVDSIFTLDLTVWPSYKDTIIRHLYNCNEGAIQYNGKLFTQDTAVVSVFSTTHGCDSIEKVFMHFNMVLDQSDTVKISDKQLPYTWNYALGGVTRDTVLTNAGTYYHTEKTHGGCYNQEKLVLIVYPTYLFPLDTTICETKLPFKWTTGPAEHQNDDLYGEVGMTKTIEYRYNSVNNTDSIYRLNLTVDAAPKATEYHWVCSGTPELIRGKVYGNTTATMDTIYRDTINQSDPNGSCDSIIYLEVFVSSIKQHTETRVLHQGETIVWGDYTIERGGDYSDTTKTANGCDSISILHVVEEMRIEKTICRTDTMEDTPADKKYPYVWVHQRTDIPNDTLYTSGIYTSTVENETTGMLEEYYSLHLTIVHPYDTTIYVHGCKNDGAWWYGQPNEIFYNDTAFIYRKEVSPADPNAPCDSIFYVNVKMDTVYEINIVDTICEHALPYIIGRVNPDTIWGPTPDNPSRKNWQHTDTTINGCDSIINLTLYITPSLPKNDSTFVCEEFFENGGWIWLGDTVSPWFDTREGGKFHGKWEGKWFGVPFSTDTIVYNCDSTLSHHIIVRPKQDVPAKDTFYLCQGDSVQLFWPYKEDWVYTEGVYRDTFKTYSSFMDETHGTIHYDKNFLCDSIIEWTVFMLDTIHEDTVVHIAMGDSLYWNNEWRYATGLYDSISYDGVPGVGPTAIQGANGLDLPVIDSRGQYCKYVMTLHLFVDSTYHFRDTLSVCEFKNKDTLYIWADGHETEFRLPSHDTAYHLIDTLPTLLYRFDSIYDLYVDYHQKYFTQIYDTICEGTEYRFDAHHHDNTQTSRLLTLKGIYYDTIPALNGCDSIIELYLETRDSIKTTHKSLTITDRDIPYYWINTWKKLDGTDTTQVDTLRSTGIYPITMWNKFGCDSTIVLDFKVHQTNVFRDTLEICEFSNTTVTYPWPTNFESRFNTPNQDSAHFHVQDTLPTRVYLDSIYDLYVIFKQKTILYKDTNICFGDSIQFGLTRAHTQRFISKSGIYQDTLVRTTNGCDSIITLRLNVYPRYFNDTTVHIADVDTPYIWNHYQAGVKIAADTLYSAGDYGYKFYSAFSCDSIDSLHLFIHKTYYITEDTINICQNETPYTWHELTNITTTGDYENRRKTTEGYDSIYYVHINVWKQVYDTITASICEGDSMRWGLTKANQPRFLYTSGIYNDTLTSIHGCDSIITLRLNVYPRYFNDTTVHIADVDTPYVWKHYRSGALIQTDSLYAAGRYGYRFPTQYGCDSIDSLTLVIHPTYEFHDTVTICYNETPYTWYNADSSEVFKNDIYTTGTYYKYLQTKDLYDSIYVRYVRVIPVITDTVRHSMCEGSEYSFNGVRYTKGGTYTDTLRSSLGCDSIVTLLLTVNKPVYIHIPVDIYEGDSYEFYGDTYTTSGTYRHAALTPEGCDSITELILTVHPQVDTIVTICKNDLPYIWTNKWSGEQKPLYTAGTYRDDTTIVNGKRTFYTLQLIVNQPVQDTIRVSICEGESYEFKGEALTTTGIYRDTVRAANGCDSVTNLVLTVNQPYYNYQVQHIIEGQTVEFFGNTYATTGTYTHFGTTPEGCDSTSILQLIVHRMVDTVVTVCSPELPYMWINKWDGSVTPLYTAGIYRNDTTYYQGEKMYYGLQLVVNDPVLDTTRVAICQGSSYRFKGMDLTEPGLYRDTLRAANGCDSIETLILSVNAPYFNTIHEDVLQGQTVDFFGQTYSATGTYYHYAHTPEGCDSTTVLELVVHPLVDTIVTICKNDLPFLWNNRWSNNEEAYYAAGTYRNDTTINGEKRFFGLEIRVNEQTFDTTRVAICEGGSFLYKGEYLTASGIYRDTVQAPNGCDSIHTLILTVNKPYFNTIHEDVLQGQTVDFFGQTYSATGTYYHYAHTPEGCDSTTVLELVVHPLVDTIVTICKNDLPFLWNNRWSNNEEAYYAAGTYRNDTTINGVKRFFGLEIRVNDQTFDTTRVAICEGSSYRYQGMDLTEAGIYRDTLRAANGCDSIHTLVLTVNKAYYNYRVEHIIEGQTVDFFGQTYSATGTYYHFSTTPEGCDSTSVLQLNVHAAVDTVVYVCSHNLPYLWVNKWDNSIVTPLYTEGTYRNDSVIVNGERMFYGLQLIIKQPTETTIYREICEGDMYNFNGKMLSTGGEYRDTVLNSIGCDSVIILHLNVLKKYYNTISRTIYEGDTVIFLGQSYSAAGNYPIRYTSSFGCDSIVELQLTVKRMYDDSVTVCANELPLIWRNRTIYESGIYRDTTTVDGKEVIIGLKVNVLPIARAAEPIVATICEGDYYKFGDEVLTAQGTYYDTLTAVNGCDSIVMLTLQVFPVKYQTTTKRIFEGDTVFFYGDTLTKSGVYEHRVLNENNCTDTYQMILTVLKESHVDTSAVICKNDLPFIWRGYEYNETGDYRLPITWTDSSRVVMTLHLTVNDTYYEERNVSLCSGDYFKFKGITYTENGFFYDTIPSLVGCDSIVKYVISVHPTYDHIFEKHVSDKQPYIFHGRELTTSGTYEWTGKTQNGCDSLEHLILTVHPSYFFSDTVDICQSDSVNYPYKWRQYDISQSGVYSDSMLTDTYGFDSVFQLVVHIWPAYMTNEQYEIGEGEVLKIHGRDISKPAIYYDTLRTIHGCDSIFHVVVNQKRTREFFWTREICQGDYFEFLDGRKLTHTGQYKYVSQYKDSVVTLNLTVNPKSITEKRIVITPAQLPYIVDGHLFEHDTIHVDTLVNQYGCDSLYRIVLVTTTHYSEWTPIPLCPGAELKIDGQVITEPGLYTYLRRSKVTGEMDSIYRVEVYDAPSYERTLERTICEGDTIMMGGKPYTHSGTFVYRGQTVDGCDSIETLILTVNPSYRFDTAVTIMDDQSFYWRGKTYNKTGMYYQGFQTELGCDSTYSLNLYVVETEYHHIDDTICNGQIYVWRGDTLTDDGYYTQIVRDTLHKFSAVYTLRLVVTYPTTITKAKTGDICADAESFDIEFEFAGKKPLSYSVIFDALAKREGFQDIYNAPLGTDMVAHIELPKYTSVVYQGHTNYVRPDYYTMRLVLDNGVCGTSRSDSLKLLIKYPTWIIEQNWGDVVAPLKAELNGGYEFSQTEWYVNGVLQPNDGLAYLHSDKLRAGDQVVMMATRKGDNYAIPTCPLTITTPLPNTNPYPILVYPTQAPRYAPNVTISAPLEGQFEVYSSTGLLIMSGEFGEGETLVTLPSVSGIYFIRTTQQGSETETHKVILL